MRSQTSEIALLDEDDTESIEAKLNLTPEKYHRFMSNNSTYYTKKPTREKVSMAVPSTKRYRRAWFVNSRGWGEEIPLLELIHVQRYFLTKTKLVI